MSFSGDISEAVVDTLCARRFGIPYLNQRKMTSAAGFATRPEPLGCRRDGGWTGGRKGRKENARQGGGSEAGKQGRSETERTKEGGKKGGREAGQTKEERFEGRRKGSLPQIIYHSNSRYYFVSKTRMRYFRYLYPCRH